jgi:hypothetical protein
VDISSDGGSFGGLPPLCSPKLVAGGAFYGVHQIEILLVSPL